MVKSCKAVIINNIRKKLERIKMDVPIVLKESEMAMFNNVLILVD